MAASRESRTPSLLDLIAAVDNAPLDFDEHNCSPFYRFFLAPDPRPHGFVHPTTIAKLPWPPSFTIDHASRSLTLTCPDAQDATAAAAAAFSPSHANTALQQAVDAALASAAFPTLSGLHSEPFRILGARAGLVQVERFAAPLFGIATRGAHLTAYVRSATTASSSSSSSGGGGGDDPPRIWVARRSRALHTYPGMLDSTVAGGVRAPDSPRACIAAEAVEEASLGAVTTAMVPAGVVTLSNVNARTGLFHSEVLHVFDAELAPDVRPTPADDEVEEFVLMPCDEVRRRMTAGEFKPNVCPVLIDFMVRHGVVTPEQEGEGVYAEICQRLRRRLPVPLRPDV